MKELATADRWLAERLEAVFGSGRVFNALLPRDVSVAAVVFQFVDGTPMLVQEREELYQDFIVDVLYCSAEGDQTMPYEEADQVHQAIKTGDAVRYTAPWRDGEITVELTCDRVKELAIPVQDGASDYREAGGRYLIRVEVVA